MKRHIDYYFLLIATVLMVLGMLFLSTLSSIASLNAFGNTHYYLFHQLIAIGIGLIAGVIVVYTPLHIIKKVIPWIFFINVILVVIAFLPLLGTRIYGASRWITIGKNSFQPSEFLKITSILYLSALISKQSLGQTKKGWIGIAKKGYDNFTRFFIPFALLLCGVGVMLFLQRDLSTLGVTTVALIAIYFASETPLWHTILAVVGIGSTAALGIIFEPYRFQRLMTFLHPETDPLGVGFQLKQSILAVGSGGIFGKGLGMSTQKFGKIPQAMTDSMFAILGEEIGLIGCTILIGIFVALVWRGFIIASKSNELFGRLVVAGVCTWIIVQTFMNMASSLGIWPLAGIPLPFFSYGGSHLVAEIIGMAMILNISKYGQKT